MKNSLILYGIVILGLVSSGTWARADADEEDGGKGGLLSVSHDACSNDEAWEFGSAISIYWRQEYQKLIGGKVSPGYAASVGAVFEEKAKTEEGKVFGSFWKFRSLYSAKLFHEALRGFNRVVQLKTNSQIVSIQIAALNCINVIQSQYTRMHIEEPTARQLPLLLEGVKRLNADKRWVAEFMDVVWSAAGTWIRTQMNEDASADELKPMFAVLTGAGAHEAFTQGIWSLQQRRFREAIPYFNSFLKTKGGVPKSVQRLMDQAHLLLARAYYSVQDFENSSNHFKQVSKDSNEMIRVLAELSWVDYMQRNYKQAIGTGLNLQSGGLRNTFAPEGFMVMAMSLNELCQFPGSLRVVRYFRKNYKPSYQWLKEWILKARKQPISATAELYPAAVSFLENKKTNIPKNVVTEWVRSPVFISLQQELNLILDEQRISRQILGTHAKEYREFKEQVALLQQEVKAEFAQFKKNNPKVPLSTELRDRMTLLKRHKAVVGGMKNVGVALQKISINYKKQAPILQDNLVNRINVDLRAINVRMIKRLKELAENVYLLEVEIYNGASEDVVWQNAHPEYKDFAKKIKDRAAAAEAETVWNWGPVRTGDAGTQEVWADELGTLKVSMEDMCTNRDRFMAIQMNQ